MKAIAFVTALILCALNLSGSGLPVVDVAAIAQAIKEYQLLMQQLETAREELRRLGDPRVAKTPAATALIKSLGLEGAGETIDEIQTAATGAAGTWFEANGIFRAPGETLQTADGQILPRAVDQYRKFDALVLAGENIKEVMHDTQERRQSIRSQIQATEADIQRATTIAEVQKLQAVLIGQHSELTAIEMERTAALGRMMAQSIYNQNDAERQQQARREEAEAGMRQATGKLGELFKVDTSPVQIPSPFGP